VFRRRRNPKDFSAEIESHLQLEAARFREQGLSEEEARMAARRAFGNVTLAEERFYEKGRWLWWDHVRQDVRYALRLMIGNPLLTATVVLTLALGIGANTVIFSVVRAVVLRPLEYRDPERIVQVWETGPREGGESDWVAFPNFLDWRRSNDVFQEMAAYRYALLTLSGKELAESVLGLEVTDRLLDVLGVRAHAGRTFLPGEDRPGHEKVAVISHSLWQRRFGGDPQISGATVNIQGQPYTIVGVMPPWFRFPRTVPGDTIVVPIDLWIPIRPADDLEERGSHNFWSIARLKPGVTVAQAQAQLHSIGAALARQYPESNKDLSAAVQRLQDHITSGVRRGLLLLLGAVGVVLLLTCVNVANLLLSRAESRRREMAVRMALGAGPRRLFAQTLTESLLMAFAGSLAGLTLAPIGTELLLKFGPVNIPRFSDTVIDTQVWLFTALIGFAAGLVFGVAPAILAAGSDAYASIKEAGARSTAGKGSLAARHILVGSQMALAVVLLTGAGLLIRSFVHVLSLDPGFQSSDVVMAFINVPQSRYPGDVERNAFFDEALRRIRSLPGVQAAAVSDSVPLTGVNNQGSFAIEGRPDPAPGEDGPHANRPHVSPEYFRALGIRLLDGRLLDRTDGPSSTPVAVISDLAAARYWPHENPIGKRLGTYDWNGKLVWRRIVGIVRGTRHFGLEESPKAEIYVPFSQDPGSFAMLVVRTANPSGLIPAVKREIAAIDSQLAALGFVTMDELVSNHESRRRFNTILIGGFAALALILAAVGIYGVTAYSVTRRIREFGVRIALGAAPRDVLRLVVGNGLVLAAVGIAAGFAASLALSRVLESLLFGVSPFDPLTFAGTGLVIAGIAILSIYIPGRGAARVDPAIALRDE
jgi:putative ABC transport system permease protein